MYQVHQIHKTSISEAKDRVGASWTEGTCGTCTRPRVQYDLTGTARVRVEYAGLLQDTRTRTRTGIYPYP